MEEMTPHSVVMLRDTLYLTHERSASSVEYGRGVLMGVVGGLMAGRNITFRDAAKIVRANLPIGYRKECIPEAWSKEIYG